MQHTFGPLRVPVSNFRKCFEALAVGNVDAETSTLLFQTLEDVRSFTVLSKAAMAKVMGEERQGKCDAFVNDTKTFFSNLKKASTDLVSMFSTTSTLGVSSLLSEELVSFMEGLANDEILANVRKMLPKLSPLISRVQRQVQECAKKILGQNASSFVGFLTELQKNDVKIDDLFTVELVGKVGTEDVDGEVVIPYGKIFDIYFKNLPEENQKIGVNLTQDPNLSGSRLFTSATVCHAASLLPLARSMMLLKDAVNDAPNKTSMADRVPSCLGAKSAELVPGSRLHYFSSDVSKIIDKTFQRFGDAGASMEKIEPGHAILVECKSRLLSMVKEFINQSIQEFSKVKELAVAKLEGASSDFKLDNVKDSESLEFALISKACADPRFHQLHSLCQVGGGALSDLRMKLKQLSASCKVFLVMIPKM
jgi:hypothetical protein